MRRIYSIALALALALAAVVPACAAGTKEPEKPTPAVPAPALIGEHLARLRKDVGTDDPVRQIGRLPRDLRRLDPEETTFRSTASGAMVGQTAMRSAFAFESLEGDRICFTDYEFLPSDDDTPVDQLRATFEQKDLRGESGIWIVTTDHLASLDTQVTWPPPAGAGRLESIEILEDKLGTYDRKRDLGDGEYLKTQQDQRTLTLRLCGTAPEIVPNAAYLVIVSHIGPQPNDEAFNPTMAQMGVELGDTFYVDRFKLAHDAVAVWTLSDDASGDLDR